VIEIKGHHFYNDEKNMTEWMGAHVRNTLLKNLREQKVQLPGGPNHPPEVFTMKELGIGYVILAKSLPLDKTHKEPNPYYEGPRTNTGGYGGSGMEGMAPGGMGMGGMVPGGMAPGGMGPGGMGPGGVGPGRPPGSAAGADDEEEEKEVEPAFFDAPKYDFIVQFCWQEKQLTERLKQRDLARQQELLEQQQETQEPTQEPTGVPDDSVAAADSGG
jgi:type IV pilus assembly protein PilM